MKPSAWGGLAAATALTMILTGCDAQSQRPWNQASVSQNLSSNSPSLELPPPVPLNLPEEESEPLPTASQSTSGADTDGGYIPPPGGGDEDDDGGYIPPPKDPAKITVTPEGFNFGVRSVHSSTHQTFVVRNVGEMPATNLRATVPAAPYSFRGGAYPGEQGDCANVLEPDASCRIVVTFRPTTVDRFRYDGFRVSHDGESVVVPLDGRGTNIATLRISNLINDNDYYSFGTIAHGTQVRKRFRVVYSGARPATGVSFSGVGRPFTLLNNACGEEITEDCEFEILYEGTVAGVTEQKIKLTYHNGSYADETDHRIYGHTSPEITPAQLTIQSASFGNRLVGSTTSLFLRVTKRGTLPATQVAGTVGSSSAFRFVGGDYPGTGGTCGHTITTDCTIAVRFQPSQPIAYQGVAELTYHNGVSSASARRNLTGAGVTPAVLSIRPKQPGGFDFGKAPLNYPVERIFILENAPGTLSASGIQIADVTAPFTYLGGCQGSLAPGARCEFTVRFVPTELGRVVRSPSVRYFDGESGQNLGFSIEGEGEEGARLEFTHETFDFGEIFLNTSHEVEFKVIYYGNLLAGECEVELKDPRVEMPDGSSPTGPSTPGFSFPGEGPFDKGTCKRDGNQTTCTIHVVFTPVVEAIYYTTLVLSYTDGTGERKYTEVVLTGSGIQTSPARLALAGPNPRDFGAHALGGFQRQTIEVRRTGELSATGIRAEWVGEGFRFVGGTYPGQGGNCGSTLPRHQDRCTLAVEFRPGRTGTLESVLSLNYHDGILPQSTLVRLTGTGYQAAYLQVTDADFGKLPRGQSAEQSLQMTNTGAETARQLSFSAPASPFSQLSHNCAAELPPGGSCTLRLRFVPSRPGHYASQVDVSYHNGVAPHSVRSLLRGTGTVSLQVQANGNHSCVRTEIGQLKCWGHNNYGQLGLGDRFNRGDRTSAPHQMGDPLPFVNLGTHHYVVSFALGHWHSCAIVDDGRVKCWGNNQYGQLGLGSTAPAWGDEPGEMGDHLPYVELGGRAMALAAGYAHTCALLEDGRVKCWGYNAEGQLGLGDTKNRGREPSDMGSFLPPVNLGSRAATRISANASHTCVLLDDRTARCWGNNFYGQLGVGDHETRGDKPGQMGVRLPPVGLSHRYRFTDISAGGAFSCGVTVEGAVKCWGRNESGILGTLWCQSASGLAGSCEEAGYPLSLPGYGTDPEHVQAGIPDVDLGPVTAVAVSSGTGSSCALTSDGDVKCWGENLSGQLGLGDTSPRGVFAEQMGSALPPVDLGRGVRLLSVGNAHACALLDNQQVRCWGNNRFGGLGLGDTEARGDEPGELGAALPPVRF